MKINWWKFIPISFSVLVIVLFSLNIYVIGFRFVPYQGETFHPILIGEMYWKANNMFATNCATYLHIGYVFSFISLFFAVCSLWKNKYASIVFDVLTILSVITVLIIGVATTNYFIDQTITKARVANNDSWISKNNFFDMKNTHLLILFYALPTSLAAVSVMFTNTFTIGLISKIRRGR